MSRKIKFRAWQDGQMLTQPLSGVYATARFMGFLYEDTELMQFTGLKDKNGKDAYEGDIVRIIFDVFVPNERHVVEWSTGECCFIARVVEIHPHSSYHQEREYHFHDGSYFEIIGTIHENPELLR